MAEERIDNYIDRNGVKGDTAFILDALNEVYSAFKKVESVKINIGGITGLSGLSSTMQQAKAGADSLAKATDTVSKRIAQMNGQSKEFTQVLLAQTKAEKELAQATLLQAKAANESAKARATEEKAIRDSTKAKEQDAKLIDQAIDDYLQLSKAYNEAALKAKNYVLRLGEGHPIAVEAVKDANNLANVLKKVDASVGQNQRNVGNYKSAFDGLGLSFKKVARELPSLAINFQTFALAISNNLPMVADEIAKAKREIAALRAEGKEVPSLFSRLKSAILSPQVGLSLLITGFTLFAGKLFGTGQAAKKLKEETQELTSAILDQINALKDQIDAVSDLDNARTKELRRNADLKNAAGKSSIEEDLKIAKEEQRIAKERITIAAINYGLNVKDAQDTEKALKQLKFTRQTANEDYKRYLQESIDARNKYFSTKKKNDKEEADALQAKAANEKAHYEVVNKIIEDGLNADNKIQEVSIKKNKEATDAAKDRRDKELRNAKDAKEAADAELQFQFEIKALELQRNIDFNKEIADNENESLLNRLSALRKYKEASTELIIQKAELDKKIGTKTATELELIEHEKFDAMLRLKRSFTSERNKIREYDIQKQEEDQKKIAAAVETFARDSFKQFNDDLEKRRRAQKEAGEKALKEQEDLNERRKQLEQNLITELTDLTFTLFTANIERQKNYIQDQIDLLDDLKQKEIESVNQTVASTEERANAIAIIEARAAAKKEALQRKQRDLDIKKAEFDKAQAIARIIQETAIQIVANLSKPVLIPLIAALGAAQLATVIATPIPRYKDGKDIYDDYEGPAIVGDGGRKEAIIREDGRVEITADTPQLTHVKKRDVVLPDANQLINYVLAGHMGGRLAIAGNGSNENSVEKEIKAMRKEVVQAIQNQPKLSLQTNEQGLAAMWKHGANQIRYINEQTNW